MLEKGALVSCAERDLECWGVSLNVGLLVSEAAELLVYGVVISSADFDLCCWDGSIGNCKDALSIVEGSSCLALLFLKW